MDAPLSADDWSAGVSPSLKRSWLRIPAAIHVSGIPRSSLYELIKAGKIKSACIRKRNSIRGIRLVNVDSLEAFIESFANGGDA
jgi:hypothetical protein